MDGDHHSGESDGRILANMAQFVNERGRHLQGREL